MIPLHYFEESGRVGAETDGREACYSCVFQHMRLVEGMMKFEHVCCGCSFDPLSPIHYAAQGRPDFVNFIFLREMERTNDHM